LHKHRSIESRHSNVENLHLCSLCLEAEPIGVSEAAVVSSSSRDKLQALATVLSHAPVEREEVEESNFVRGSRAGEGRGVLGSKEESQCEKVIGC
jgi:hypothetical protein